MPTSVQFLGSDHARQPLTGKYASNLRDVAAWVGRNRFSVKKQKVRWQRPAVSSPSRNSAAHAAIDPSCSSWNCEPTIAEILSDSAVRAMMEADGVDPNELEAMLRRMVR